MNGTLLGFLMSCLCSFRVSFLGMSLALEIWSLTKRGLYPLFVKYCCSSVDRLSK